MDQEPAKVTELNADRTPKRGRGIYLLPNLFTTAALFAGFYAVLASMNDQFEKAAIAIFVAMILDGLDGRVARMTTPRPHSAPSTTACRTWWPSVLPRHW